MPPQIVDDLIAAVTAANTVEDSATVFINGVPAMIQDAVTKATAGGATAAQLAPFTDLITAVQAKSSTLQAAVIANTPVGPTVPPGTTPTVTTARKR